MLVRPSPPLDRLLHTNAQTFVMQGLGGSHVQLPAGWLAGTLSGKGLQTADLPLSCNHAVAITCVKDDLQWVV